jgi:hypothetical protein
MNFSPAAGMAYYRAANERYLSASLTREEDA